MIDEKDFLDKAADTYKTGKSYISKWSIDSYMKIYRRFVSYKGRGLEMGCSNGYSTICLSDILEQLDIVDGSKKMLDKLSNNIINRKNVKFIYSLFEELKCEEEYDYVFCSYVLEHVVDPGRILAIGYKALKPMGKMFITVPNARALSRQMALEMGGNQ